MSVFWIFWFAALVLILVFGAVLLVGAPYMPTLAAQRMAALDLLDLKAGQTLYELGSGDGSLLREAAQRGLIVVGYELNPFLVAISWLRTLKYRRQVKIRMRNFWTADLSLADGIFVFLLDRFMAQLDEKIQNEGKKGVVLVSHAFKVPGRKPAAKNGPLFLYSYNNRLRTNSK
jgi:SAM-dependent methyltransferase